MQRTMKIYATLGHLCHVRQGAGRFRHVGNCGKIEQGISVTLRLFCHGGPDPTDNLNLTRLTQIRVWFVS